MTDPTGTDKAEARKRAYARRKDVHSEARSARACWHLINFLRPMQGKPITGYMAIRTETDPMAAMVHFADYGPVGVPVIKAKGQPLEFHRWEPGCVMQEGPFGASVPAQAEPVVPRALIVPLVAFDNRGHRLGYGGGFYDRTLQSLRAGGAIVAVGLAYAGQEVGEVPVEPTDQPLDAVVTENGVVSFTQHG